jgi:tetratricopeptide (TPR) repeat protein
MPPRRMIKSPTPREEAAAAPAPKVAPAPAPTTTAVVAAPPSASTSLGEEQMKAANELFKNGEFLKAAGMYTKAAKSDPDNAVVHCNLAYALLKVNKFDKAIAAADRCLALDPESFKGHFRKGLATYGALEFEKSVDCFAASVDKSPENSPARREAQKMLQRARWQCKKAAEKENQEVPANSVDATNPDDEKENEMTPKEKMAKQMNTMRQQRVRKNVQVAMNKVVAASEALDELEEQTPFGAGKKVSTVASEIPEEEIAKLSSEEAVIAAKKRLMEGEQVSYNNERVGKFAEAELAALRDVANRSQYVHPIAIFLPGTEKEGWGHEGSGVGMRGAFDSVKTYKRMPDFLRDWAAKTLAHAVLIVVPKSQVAYPTVWKGDEAWPGTAGADGFICQLETPEAKERKAWFIELGSDGKDTVMHDLNPLTQCILPPVYQKMVTKTNAARKGAIKSTKKKSGKKKGRA